MQEYEVILTWEAIYDVTDTADYIEAEFGQDRADRFQEDIKKGMETRSPCSKGIAGGTQLAEYIEKDKELYLSNITFMQEDAKKVGEAAPVFNRSCFLNHSNTPS